MASIRFIARLAESSAYCAHDFGLFKLIASCADFMLITPLNAGFLLFIAVNI
ncbi:ribosomal protein L33 [Gardnerella vaginalis 5-1]|nr:ribosomal protein L33 [Gardnerella vaginalis 5-1]